MVLFFLLILQAMQCNTRNFFCCSCHLQNSVPSHFSSVSLCKIIFSLKPNFFKKVGKYQKEIEVSSILPKKQLHLIARKADVARRRNSKNWFQEKCGFQDLQGSSKSQPFGVGQTIWAHTFWGIRGIFEQFISTHFGIVHVFN